MGNDSLFDVFVQKDPFEELFWLSEAVAFILIHLRCPTYPPGQRFDTFKPASVAITDICVPNNFISLSEVQLKQCVSSLKSFLSF